MIDTLLCICIVQFVGMSHIVLISHACTMMKSYNFRGWPLIDFINLNLSNLGGIGKVGVNLIDQLYHVLLIITKSRHDIHTFIEK